MQIPSIQVSTSQLLPSTDCCLIRIVKKIAKSCFSFIKSLFCPTSNPPELPEASIEPEESFEESIEDSLPSPTTPETPRFSTSNSPLPTPNPETPYVPPSPPVTNEEIHAPIPPALPLAPLVSQNPPIPVRPQAANRCSLLELPTDLPIEDGQALSSMQRLTNQLSSVLQSPHRQHPRPTQPQLSTPQQLQNVQSRISILATPIIKAVFREIKPDEPFGSKTEMSKEIAENRWERYKEQHPDSANKISAVVALTEVMDMYRSIQPENPLPETPEKTSPEMPVYQREPMTVPVASKSLAILQMVEERKCDSPFHQRRNDEEKPLIEEIRLKLLSLRQGVDHSDEDSEEEF